MARGKSRAFVERRREDLKFNALSKRIEEVAAEVTKNTEITKKIGDDTAGLIEAWAAFSGVFKVLKWLGWCAKWVTIVAGMVVALFAAWSAGRGGDIGPL